MATAHATGAAAIVLEARSKMNPGSLKDLLRRTADTSLNAAAYDTVDPQWDDAFGAGLLGTSRAALSAAAARTLASPPVSSTEQSREALCPIRRVAPLEQRQSDIDNGAPPQVPCCQYHDCRGEQRRQRRGGSAGELQDLRVRVGTVKIPPHRLAADTSPSREIRLPVEQESIPASPSHQWPRSSIDYRLDTNLTTM